MVRPRLSFALLGATAMFLSIAVAEGEPGAVCLGDRGPQSRAYVGVSVNPADASAPVYVYTISGASNAAGYDEALAAVSLQGIINRDGPRLYLMTKSWARPQMWFDLFASEGEWLHARDRRDLHGLGDVVKLAGKRLRGAVIWDPSVPATVNVATTIAGVEDAVVLSPEMAQNCLAQWRLPVLRDLRGMFTGKQTGSSKNDAYRWAISEYLARGRCSSRLICLYRDAAGYRNRGDISYAVVRDLAVRNRAFVFDLSPWGDEKPGDDPDQPLGLDLQTYRMILRGTLQQSAGKHMTEMEGFFDFDKYSNMPGHPSKHEAVPTEWESVYLISPYNCYQNTATEFCYNQSFHGQFPFVPLKQHRPVDKHVLQNKAYLTILMADYDSAFPLYEFLPKNWQDSGRGKLPLAWGIDPNLIESYPDIISHLYRTATPNDYFVSDASAAGYMNPNRVAAQYLPLFTRHNQFFFRQAGMSIAAMVLDWDQPTGAVKDAFSQFAPDGYATIVMDLHGKAFQAPTPQVWKGMPVMNLCGYPDSDNAKASADAIAALVKGRPAGTPGFYFMRATWLPPSKIVGVMDALRRDHPDIDFEVVDPYTLFDLLKQHLEPGG